MRRIVLVALALSGLSGCGAKFDERHLDGIDLSGATIADFRNRYGLEEERTALYILGVPVYHRLRFKLAHEDAQRFTMAPSGPLYVDEGSSHNAIRVWLPMPKAPRSYEEAAAKWGDPIKKTLIQPPGDPSMPVNLIGMNCAEFLVGDMEVGLFYDGDSDRIGMITWAPALKETAEDAEAGGSPDPAKKH